MLDDLTRAEYDFLLRHDFTTFAGRCFQELNPQTDLAVNWHLEVIATALTAVREGTEKLRFKGSRLSRPAWTAFRRPHGRAF